MSLATDTRALVEAVNDVDRLHLEGDDRDFIALAMIRDCRATLAHVERELEQKLSARMCDKRHVIENVGTFERRKRVDRKEWDTDALKSAVLDSRLFDAETGEIVEETPLERILHVWRLDPKCIRVTALKARGIQADQFCRTENAGFSIQIID